MELRLDRIDLRLRSRVRPERRGVQVDLHRAAVDQPAEARGHRGEVVLLAHLGDDEADSLLLLAVGHDLRELGALHRLPHRRQPALRRLKLLAQDALLQQVGELLLVESHCWRSNGL